MLSSSQPGTPTLYLIRSRAKWEVDAVKIAEASGIRLILLSDASDFLSLESIDQQDSCVMIDGCHPTINWSNFRRDMLSQGIEIPVLIVAPDRADKNSHANIPSFPHHLIIDPLENDVLLSAVEFALRHSRFVQKQIAVERSHQRFETLTERERSILSMAVEGAPNKQIAKRLGYHVKTIERIRNLAYEKLKVRSTAEMTRIMTLAEFHEFGDQFTTPPAITPENFGNAVIMQGV